MSDNDMKSLADSIDEIEVRATDLKEGEEVELELKFIPDSVKHTERGFVARFLDPEGKEVELTFDENMIKNMVDGA